MKAVIQRVKRATVRAGELEAAIGPGLLVLAGLETGDTVETCAWAAAKIASLRIFEDAEGKMNLAVGDVGGSLLLVSQFTLFADARKGRRPSYDLAAPAETARPLYERALARARESVLAEAGVFQASMRVAYVNEGPVTILLDSKRIF